MSIELYIERLVIDEALLGGERAGDVRAAIERELMQRLAQPGAVDALRGRGAVSALPAESLPLATRPREALGTRIAAAVQHGLGISPVAPVAGKER